MGYLPKPAQHMPAIEFSLLEITGTAERNRADMTEHLPLPLRRLIRSRQVRTSCNHAPVRSYSRKIGVLPSRAESEDAEFSSEQNEAGNSAAYSGRFANSAPFKTGILHRSREHDPHGGAVLYLFGFAKLDLRQFSGVCLI